MMKNQKRLALLSVSFFLLMLLATNLLAIERSEIQERDHWDVTALYPNLAAFTAERDAFPAAAAKLERYQGLLGESAAMLKEGLDLYYALERRLRHMESYVSCLYDQDARVSDNKAFKSEVETLRTNFAKLSSFINPEIIALDRQRLEDFLQDPGLAIYRFPISETIRKQAFIRPPAEERILAAAYDLAGVGESVYNLFADADMPQETITLADGSQVKLSYTNYANVRRSLVEADRVLAFTTFMGQFDRFKRTFGELLYSQVKAHRFYANMRGYDSTLAAALDRDGVDTKIYHSLIAAAHRHLPTLHRYLKLKARILGKNKLDYTDIYVPFAEQMRIKVTYEQAQEMLLEAFRPLGTDYVKVVGQAFRDRWIDVYPNDGKTEGAYSNGWAYDTHPYVLMNFDDSWEETMTLAHEMGHAVHSYLANHTQPFPTADYSTFVAEVASTFNENLLRDTMLKKVASDKERLYLLGDFLDGNIKGTFFRQIQFAEFELLIHERVERGEALTGEILSKMYLDLTRMYYGHDQGVMNVQDLIAPEWAVVPHFYYNYYLFQYATSVAAASVLSEKVIAGQAGALARYLNMLQSGGSDNPIRLLTTAGADMTDLAAYEALMQRANRYMDEVEQILAAQGH